MVSNGVSEAWGVMQPQFTMVALELLRMKSEVGNAKA
jgi:hypothetical protein